MERLRELVAVAVAFVALTAAIVFIPGTAGEKLKLATGYALLAIVFGLGAVLVVNIATGKIDLSELFDELDGGASMSRFQMLVFTFVIGLSFFHVSLQSDKIPDVSSSVLTLLGISASTYGISKGIQVSAGLTGDKKAVSKPAEEPGAAPETAFSPTPR